jgi:signal peptidase I
VVCPRQCSGAAEARIHAEHFKDFSTQPLPPLWCLANIALNFCLNFWIENSPRAGRADHAMERVPRRAHATIVPSSRRAYDEAVDIDFAVLGANMSQFPSTRRISIVHLSVGTLVLALMLRTWLVMGLIEPVTVAGSSMAPALRGPFIEVRCDRCAHRFDIGAEFQTARVECLRCGYAKNSAEGLPVQRGDSLLIDRTAFEFRNPGRWEPVVFRSPDDGQLTVKRVVGLPGESIQLRDGDVWINGRVATKSLAEMRALRRLIHEETSSLQRWQAESSRWRWSDSAWQIVGPGNEWHWLGYQHPANTAITSDFAYNAGLTRRLFVVRDFALSMNVRSVGGADLAIRFDDGTQQATWVTQIPDEALIEVFAFDRSLRMYVEGQLVKTENLDAIAPPAGTPAPFAVGTKSSALELRDLRLYHDIYHASEAEEFGGPLPMPPVKLGPDEIYVLGDNVPVSIDSRRWGPVPLRLLVGKPVGVH